MPHLDLVTPLFGSFGDIVSVIVQQLPSKCFKQFNISFSLCLTLPYLTFLWKKKYAACFLLSTAKSQQSKWPIPYHGPLDSSAVVWRLSVIKCLCIFFFSPSYPRHHCKPVSPTHSNTTWAGCTDNYQLFMSQHVTGDLCLSLSPPCILAFLSLPLASPSVMRGIQSKPTG